MTTHSNFSVLNFKLGVQTNYPLAWMFFFRTLATAFPTSYRMKTVCSCWVWKLSNDACPLNLVPSASFLTQSDWLEMTADQSLCIKKKALGTKLMPTKTMVRPYVIGNVWMYSKAFYTSKVRLYYIGNSAISLYKKIIDINLWAQLCLGHYSFHNSVSHTRLQLPVLNSSLLYQASLPYVKFSDCCHSAHELG